MRNTLGLEQLEVRRLLATYVVDSNLDIVDLADGVLTLREAMLAANESVDETDIIQFADNVRGEIQLLEGQLEYTDSQLTLMGPGPELLTIRGTDPTPEVLDGMGDRILSLGAHPADVESVEIQGLTFAGGDSSSEGGAIFNETILTVKQSVFRANNAGDFDFSCNVISDGGAIDTSLGDLFVEDSWFDGNQACGDGGAIYGGVHSITRSAFTDNFTYGQSGSDGGAIAHRSVNTVISNSFFRGNHVSDGVGEAIHARALRENTVRIENSTVVANGSRHAVDIESGVAEIVNSIFANDFDVRSVVSTNPLRFSIVSNSLGLRVRPTNGELDEYGNLIGSLTSPVDPMLGPVEFVRGLPSQAPMEGSPAIDRGDPEFSVGPDDVDLRGQARKSGVRIDIGAVESQESAPEPDVNGDGVLGCADIDAIKASARNGVSDAAHDLNRDGKVDGMDVGEWLVQAGLQHESALPFHYGDANLDGQVDAEDFNVWRTYRFTNASSWCEANFTDDSAVDGSDFNLWNDHQFARPEMSPLAIRTPMAAAEAQRSVPAEGDSADFDQAKSPPPIRNRHATVRRYRGRIQRAEPAVVDAVLAEFGFRWLGIRHDAA